VYRPAHLLVAPVRKTAACFQDESLGYGSAKIEMKKLYRRYCAVIHLASLLSCNWVYTVSMPPHFPPSRPGFDSKDFDWKSFDMDKFFKDMDAVGEAIRRNKEAKRDCRS
jgi:hypothetical protein